MEGVMKSLSEDIRRRVIEACKSGASCASVADRFVINVRTVHKLWQRYRETGSVLALQRGGYRRSRVAGHEQQIRGWIKMQPDLTLAELCERLAEHGVSIKIPALWHQLNTWGLSYKKNATRLRAATRRRTKSANRVEAKSARA
jgi:transposase